jgi:hypothetical protein
MKKSVIFIIAALSLFQGLKSQNIDDALRYSQIFYGGTARFMSMGGAFSALGGDISSLSQNPAGLGVFRSSEITITPQLFHSKVNTDFHGVKSDFMYNFNLGQAGIVSNLISNTNESGLITLNFGYSFNKTNNFNQSMQIEGVSNTSSMSDYWAGWSEGTYYKDLSGVEGIAYDAWIMDTITGSGGSSYGTVFSNYGDNYPSVYGQNIRRLVSNEGYTGEHAISIGGNYSNKVFFGATLGISKLKYTSHYEHNESTTAALPSKFRSFTYTDHYEDQGTGYSLKLGAIIKPVDALRIGLAFHSPTIYRINEYFYENITSSFTDGGKYQFSNDPLRFQYALTTPFRAIAGVAVQVKKFALLSADYEFVDYSMAKFRETGDNYDYSQKNRNIKNGLQSASNIRLGGEFRLNKLYLRTGYGYYGKAFQPGEDNAELDYQSLSFGAGYRERNISLDFAFTSYKNSQSNFLYPLADTFAPAVVNISETRNMFTFTLGYKFGY